MIALNTAVASQLREFRQEVDTRMAAGEHKEHAIFELLREYIRESKPIRFDGNGYSDEWREEAHRRGLDCESSVPLIYDAYTSPSSVKMFEETGVMNRTELAARNEVKWDTYIKKVQIEARVLGDIVLNHIIPVATRYQSALLDNVYKMRQVYDIDKARTLSAHDDSLIEELSEHIASIKQNVDSMVEARKQANHIANERERAIAYHDTVLPYFDVIRYHVDKLELIVDDELWPLPKYREILFSH